MLNTLQKKAYDSVFSNNFTIISGSAGTGKTYLLVKILERLLSEGKKVLICSPTHVSLKVIKDTLSRNQDIDHPNLFFKTMASALAKFPSMDINSGDIYFSRGSITKVLQNSDYILVDEYSAVSNQDFEIIKFLCFKEKKKVILFGDMNQLLPVRQKAISLPSSKNGGIEIFELTQQMRNQGEIKKLSDDNRVKVKLPTRSSSRVKVLDRKEILQREFLSALGGSPNPLSICYLAYRNSEVDSLSSKISIKEYPYLRMSSNHSKFCKNGDNLKILRILEEKIYEETYGFYYDIIEVQNIESGAIFSLYYTNKENKLKVDRAREVLKASLKHTPDLKLKNHICKQLQYLLDSFPEYSSPFVLTVHKSQGSTYDQVFIDTRDILRSNNKRRLMYVAISRAKEKVYLLNNI